MIYKYLSATLIFLIIFLGYINFGNLTQWVGEKRRIILGPHVSDYQATPCPKGALGIYVFGQSNSANTVKPMKEYVISEDIVQYDWRTDKCYKYQEPLLGAMDFFSNPITPLMANLPKAYQGKVILIPFGVPGSSIIEWSYGTLRLLHKNVYKQTSSLGMQKSLTLFIQGERDVGDEDLIFEQEFANSPHFFHIYSFKHYSAMSENDYYELLIKVAKRSLAYSVPNSNFGIVQTTKCGVDKVDIKINQAQANAAKEKGIFLAANLDELDVSKKFRYNKCRLNPNGANILSDQLFNSIKLLLNNE